MVAAEGQLEVAHAAPHQPMRLPLAVFLAGGYAKQLAMNGFSIREGMNALKPYVRLKGASAKSLKA